VNGRSLMFMPKIPVASVGGIAACARLSLRQVDESCGEQQLLTVS
jgi:hypothetical protein